MPSPVAYRAMRLGQRPSADADCICLSIASRFREAPETRYVLLQDSINKLENIIEGRAFARILDVQKWARGLRDDDAANLGEPERDCSDWLVQRGPALSGRGDASTSALGLQRRRRWRRGRESRKGMGRRRSRMSGTAVPSPLGQVHSARRAATEWRRTSCGNDVRRCRL